MKKFDMNDFLGNRRQELVCECYRNSEILPIEEFEIVMGNHLVVKDPFSDHVAIIDESAEIRNEDGNWEGTVRLVKSILTSEKLAEKLTGSRERLKTNEMHFIIRSREEGFSIHKLEIFDRVVFIMQSWGGELSMYDASDNRNDVHDIEAWICDFTVCNPEEHIYEIDRETRIALNHEQFEKTYQLKPGLQCPEEGWFISDAGDGYRVEADDDHRDLCRDDDLALERAKARGIRFHENNPSRPVGLIYPHKPHS